MFNGILGYKQRKEKRKRRNQLLSYTNKIIKIKYKKKLLFKMSDFKAILEIQTFRRNSHIFSRTLEEVI